ncbi:MAG: aldo/keto reductase [Anaerolineae bacterium]|nr:aldo/keto reductase [Anaerolineae bacterium]
MTGAKPQNGLPRRRLGSTPYEVTVLGVGGWLGLLDDPKADRTIKEAAAIEAVRRAVDLGVNYFDTAPGNGGGEAERHLGLGLKELGPEERAHLVVSTKVGTHPKRLNHYDAGSIFWSVEQSQRILYTDHIDLIFIHDPVTDAHMDQILGPGGAVEALEKLKAQGVIGAFGMGVPWHHFLRRAIADGRFDAILTSYDYNLVRASAGPLIEMAAALGLGVVNGSPYNAGLMAMDPVVAAARRGQPRAGDLARARALWHWCRARGVELGAVAVQYSIRNERIAATLAGPRDPAEVEANVRHATTPLPPDIWEALDTFLATLGPWPQGGEAWTPK